MTKEFNYIYIINLKGGVRGLSKEQIKKEGKNIFDIMTGVAIILLIKDGSSKHYIKYHDIGDALTKKEKLDILRNTEVSILKFNNLSIDNFGDWLNHRDPHYYEYVSLNNKDRNSLVNERLIGFNTNRDAWTFNFSKDDLIKNVNQMINNYNDEVDRLYDDPEPLEHINLKTDFISWSAGLKRKMKKREKIKFNKDAIIPTLARPFTKKFVYYDSDLVERPGRFRQLIKNNDQVIFMPGIGGSRGYSCLIAKGPINLHCMGFASSTQVFPLYLRQEGLFENTKILNINNVNAQKLDLKSNQVFPYIYCLLNDSEFIAKYKDELQKDYPRIPKVKFKDRYVNIGQKLMNLHLNYEDVPIYDEVDIKYSGTPNYKVKRMKFPKKRNNEGKKVDDKSTIVFNDSITISNIPEKAYEYVVNGKSAIEWIMDQYRINPDKKSGIIDDPNDYSDDPKYIFNLLLKVINVSVQTVDLINQLPPLEIEE